MQNIWDQLPPPKNGDKSDSVTFEAVGRALTSWELVETRLSWLFRALINVRGWPIPSERAFGSIATSRGRIDMLAAASDALIFGYEDKAPRDELRRLLKLCREFSSRRNEIAHGIVMPYPEAVYHDGHGDGWVLAPAIYNTTKQMLAPRGMSEPKYIYASPEINYYQREFENLIPVADATRRAVEIVTGALKP